MSKLTRSESSRLNGAKSRGPRSSAGRSLSSVNAIRHGLTSKTLILQNESSEQFVCMLNAYFDLLQPANQIEIDLVSEIVAARWRLRRIWRYETAILDVEMDTQASDFEKRFEKFDEDIRGGVAFSNLADKSRGLATALRFDVHLSRTYRRALDEIRRLRAHGFIGLQNEPEHALNSLTLPPQISTEPTVGQVPDLPGSGHK